MTVKNALECNMAMAVAAILRNWRDYLGLAAYYFVRASFCKVKKILDCKNLHGELDENDVAKCSEQRGSDIDIDSTWIEILLGI
ncbi:hypothetical protein KIN20_031846 [Parelaphostrongylus tenuis]|uniref:Uncharacterized protein n=1 Tax=Parelaphostrongylus tenuis TaxID=148309 RepID=A0AAD5WHK7_PARTN|nr:hypothetical protein KIN20_031846 [Parelaphostrongylus tenuis]